MFVGLCDSKSHLSIRHTSWSSDKSCLRKLLCEEYVVILSRLLYLLRAGQHSVMQTSCVGYDFIKEYADTIPKSYNCDQVLNIKTYYFHLQDQCL